MAFRTSASILALCSGLLFAPAALAQQTPATTASDPVGAAQAPSGQQLGDADEVQQGGQQRADIIAGETGAATRASSDIVVTGTRIVRPNNRSAAPITSTTYADIAAQGATTIEEVLNRLPQVQPNSEQNYADSDGRQRIKLRNLGFERTLTLVDGLRLGLQNGLDVSIIPTQLVERVDVLSGGASSVYGSDAVSGVVNFILKKNFDGVSLTGNYSFYNHDNGSNAVTDAAARANFPARRGLVNDGGRVDVSLAAGKTFFGDAVNITGFVNYRESDQVSLGARSYSACEATQPVRDGPLSCTVSTYTPNGTIVPQSGPNRGTVFVNNPNGSQSFVPYGSGPNTSANPYDNIAFQRQFKRLNAGGFLTAKLSDDIELYSTALWYRDRSANTLPNRVFAFSAYGATPFQVNCNNPFLSASQAATLGCATGSTASVPLDVRYRFDGLPLVETRFENTGVRVAGGLRGRVLDDVWSYDVAGVYSRNKGTTNFPAFPDFDRVNRSLNVVNVGGTPTCVSVVNGSDPACVPFNAFVANNNTAALNTYLFTDTDGTQSSISRLWQGVATLSGDLGKYGITSPIANDGVAIAFGAEFRSEKFVSTADEQFRLTNGGTDARYTQNVWEVNAEVQAPLVQEKRWTNLLQVNGGYRVSSYNRLQGRFDTWKVEGLWAPVADITFRGSYNKAQRAPTVIEAVQASNINYVTAGSRNDPCAPQTNPANPNAPLPPSATIAQCRNTGLPDNLYGSATLTCPDDSCTIRNGGFNLTPETAYTKTFGVVLRPRFTKGLTVSVDRFLIDLNDSINYFAANDYLNGCLSTGLDYYCRGVVRNPGTFTLSSPAAGNPTTGYIAQGTSNGYKSKSHGWDFQGQYNLGLGSAGAVDLSFNGTLTDLVGSQDSPDVPKRNCVGYFGPNCGESLPRWRHTLRTVWIAPGRYFNVSVNWRHTGPSTITFNADPEETGIPVTAADRRTTYARIRPYDYIDLSAAFEIAKAYTLRVSVNNLFDKDPPLLPNSRSVLGLLRNNTLMGYDLLGRQIVAGVALRF